MNSCSNLRDGKSSFDTSSVHSVVLLPKQSKKYSNKNGFETIELSIRDRLTNDSS